MKTILTDRETELVKDLYRDVLQQVESFRTTLDGPSERVLAIAATVLLKCSLAIMCEQRGIPGTAEGVQMLSALALELTDVTLRRIDEALRESN
jgi:hypothetical protein